MPRSAPGVPVLPADVVDAASQPSTLRLFGSPAYFRLWLAQVASSLGDWVGLLAISAIAARVGGSSPEAAIGIVLSARLVPGFFLAPAAGVFVDRWDRKKVMVSCDVGRGVVLLGLPFVDTIPGLFFASLLLEIMTLMWSPAKEASVPNLVRPEFLANANSLSLVAAYGTFPIGSALFAVLAGVASGLGRLDALESLRVSQETVAIYVDVLTFFTSAVLISTLNLRRPEKDGQERGPIDLRQTFRELADGWRFIRHNKVVRSVMLGLGTGLIGGGMVVPLGPVMSASVLGAGTAGFGLLLTALGTGMAVGVVTLSVVQRRVPHERIFVASVFGAGASLLLAASMSSLTPALAFVAVMGLCAGSVYILGFTILQANVEDELRGRIFAALYTLVRFCLLLSFTVAPILSSLLDRLSARAFDRSATLGGVAIALPGVRLTLWLGGLIIVVAGALVQVTKTTGTERDG
ncbi:MAG: MFS transporter [Actinomycetota bacterium]|nr:MFS transporter [Actinomycetota bacterium]